MVRGIPQALTVGKARDTLRAPMTIARGSGAPRSGARDRAWVRPRFGPWMLLFLLVLAPIGVVREATAAPAAQPAGEEPPAGIDFQWGVRIPMRDGVRLSATIYRPKPAAGRLPVIFTLTPYTADSYHERATWFARHGYVFALVDCRGRGNSEGRFEPMVNDGRDGHDVVEWLARQPWSDGKVTMWGGSYAGFDQWSTLKEFPPHLLTIVPAAAAHPAIDFPFDKNILYPYDLQWLTFTSGLTANGDVFNDDAFWIEKFREHYLKHLPFRDLDLTVGNRSTAFRTWVAHPTPDAYWDAMVPSAAQYRKIDVPILTITGHYDADQRGALEYYRRHMKHGSPAARERPYLVAGPWDHAGTRTPKREVGGLTFGEASLVDLNGLHREWYDWTLKGGPRPGFLKKRVAYYVAGPGAEEWRYADSLETIATGRVDLYLASKGEAGDVFRSGLLQERAPVGDAAADAYTYDPLDVRPAELEKEEVKSYLTDQRGALNLFGNGLIYHSAPFPEATEVTGSFRLTAFIALDVPDTDFQAAVYEILPDGSSVYLASDLLRARYRESLEKERLVTPGAVLRYDFDGFPFISRRVSRGSRLRLVFGCPNSIHIQKNYNGGGVVAEESGKDARPARVTLYHDAERPSRLEVPVVRPAGGG